MTEEGYEQDYTTNYQQIHSGIDIGTDGVDKLPVYSVTDGVVVGIEKGYKGVGDLVIIKELNTERYWMYLHVNVDPSLRVLGSILPDGTTSNGIISAGKTIAKIAPTSYTGLAPHLHLTVANNSQPTSVLNAYDETTVLGRTVSPLQAYWEYRNR
ncbi:M23 family metallopeptidase [Microcoleus sp. Pol12A5]|uniref:M23 family metallopeptidase n=1 Tax=Microcoleus sp. Pol12A5 TaxID=3055392 RepID=UPI002FD6663B